MSQKQGYAGKILRIDLSTGEIGTVPTATYGDRYLGGRGIAAKIHWDEVPPRCKAVDPENRLVVMTGPLCGIPGLAGSRWQVSGKSPVRDRFSYCNLGGSWGAQLKFAGYDGLIVKGRADKLCYLLIEDEKVELRDASSLKGKGAITTREELKEELGKSVRVMAVGAAGENMVTFASITADYDSSGSGGLGAVMGSKNLKAIAVKGQGKVVVADKESLSSLRKEIKAIKYKLQPWPSLLPAERMKEEICFGCINGCPRMSYTPKEGRPGKYYCQSAMFYEIRAKKYYGEVNDVPYHANKLCDDYGVDTRAVETMTMWLSRCHKAGLLTDEETGIPLSKIGSLEFMEILLHKISFRQGFGDTLARGTLKAAQEVGKDADKLITDYMVGTGENELYGGRLYITTGMFYAMEPRQPIQQLHEISPLAMMWVNPGFAVKDNYMTSEVMRNIGRRFWGDEIAADFSTYEGKALAAAKIQNRQYAKECLILCDFSWPMIHSPTTQDHVGDPTLESRICAAVTGLDIDEQGLYGIGERIMNLQRAVLAREGKKGREGDSLDEFNFSVPLRGDFGNPESLVPGKDGEPFARKGLALDRDAFEKVKDEYYEIRGWDVATGLQTKTQLERLDLGEIAETLKQEGLLA